MTDTEKKVIKDLKKELDFLYKVTKDVHSLEIDSLLREIVKIAVEVSDSDSCLIYVLDPQKNELVLRASKNPRPQLLKKIKMKIVIISVNKYALNLMNNLG